MVCDYASQKLLKNCIWHLHTFFSYAYENIYSLFKIWGTILELWKGNIIWKLLG